MPVLNQIELFLDGTYSSEEKKDFIFKSRCICNYLERALAEEGFETTLSRVNIHCSKRAIRASAQPLKGAPYLEVRIHYDVPRVAGLDEPALQHHYMRIIDLGLSAADEFMPVPYSYCMEVLQQFENGGFVNEWVQAEKNWEKPSVQCKVLARLTTEKFTILQQIYRDGDLIADDIIAETRPREMLFIDYLGGLSLDRSRNIVYKRKKRLLSKFNLDTNEFVDVTG